MRRITISVAYAARNFTDCISRVRKQNTTFVLLKNGSPVPRLTPESEKVCLGRDLAAALAKTTLTEHEASTWRRDLQTACKSLKAPADI